MVSIDVDKVRADMTVRGWLPADLADHAAVSRATMSRFLSQQIVTPRTLAKVARALRVSPRRYVIRTAVELAVDALAAER